MIPCITIAEILGRAEQGMTRPFLCKGEDLQSYYVKGAYAGLRSLCCEWVANRLVNLVLTNTALAVPRCAMAAVPSALVEGSARKDARELGTGKAFASLRLEGGQELNWAAASDWPEETMALLLLLDLWLQNEDRSLSSLGGNPNLMVEQAASLSAERRLWAYDFNLAFDEGFDRERFFAAHVFGTQLKSWPSGFREQMEPRLHEALEKLGVIFNELPLDWLHIDGDDSLPVQLDRGRVMYALALPFSQPDLFWKLP